MLSAGAVLTAQATEVETHTIGEVTALIPEASTADEPSEFAVDGQSGDTDFPFISRMKPIATVGEYDAKTGNGLTGYPDGNAAYLLDDDVVLVLAGYNHGVEPAPLKIYQIAPQCSAYSRAAA